MTAATTITFPYILTGKRAFVSDLAGGLGRAIAKRMTHEAADVLDAQMSTEGIAEFIARERPQAVVIIADALGTGCDRIAQQSMILEVALESGVEKLMFVARADIYPANVLQPVMEIFLETDPVPAHLDDNAKASVAGIKLCSDIRRARGADFFSSVHAELYGPNCSSNCRGKRSIVSSLIGGAQRGGLTGLITALDDFANTSRHELLHVDDAAEALVHLMANYTGETHVNVGAGYDISPSELAAVIASIARFDGDVGHAVSNVAAPRNLLNTRRLAATGWRPRIDLRQGIAETWGWHKMQEQA